MSMTSLEREILAELKEVTGSKKLTMSMVMEWSTSEDKVRKDWIEEEEYLIYCPKLGVWVTVLKPKSK